MNVTKNIDAPIYEPFVDDEGSWVHVTNEHVGGSVTFSDGGIFIPCENDVPFIDNVPERVTEKECVECGEVKTLNAYHRDSRGVGGVRSVCKQCRSTKQAKTTPRRIEDHVWLAEAKRVCPCAVCGDTPRLPNSVEAARMLLQAFVPLCERCDDGSHWIAQMKAEQWHRFTDERLFLIEVFHDVTVLFKNVPRTRKPAAKKWLAGIRDLSDPYISGVLYETVHRLANAASKTDLPSVITDYKHDKIRHYEVAMSDCEQELTHLLSTS